MPVQILVPELGESVVEATVGQWRKKEGERVSAGEPLVELETDKVNLEVSAAQSGVLARIERKQGDDVKIGEVLGVIEEGKEGTEEKKGNEGNEIKEGNVAVSETAPSAEADGKEREVTPVARRMAEELGVDLAQVSGSGNRGRVTKEDVQAFAEKKKVKIEEAPPAPRTQDAPRPPAESVPPEPTVALVSSSRPEERLRMSRRRRTIAQRLVEAQHTAAMLTTFNEIDLGAVMALRARRKDSFKERHGVGLGFMSFFVKAVVGALTTIPQLNAEIQGDEVVLKRYYDIGIAVGAEEGLVVPVLRDADRMSFGEIERRIKELADKARASTLTLDELRGGTFTITNGGVFGSLLSTPILNPPQSGILGMHKIEERPVAQNGQVVIRPMMYVALSYDHRLVDGREAVQFLVRVKELIEDPETLLLEG
ncbi:MAG: 2-oxoglutarate dehydrogenase complex dihydrolipoyllysine-residue succinyltransferase [Anaerolineales bacterium]